MPLHARGDEKTWILNSDQVTLPADWVVFCPARRRPPSTAVEGGSTPRCAWAFLAHAEGLEAHLQVSRQARQAEQTSPRSGTFCCLRPGPDSCRIPRAAS
jgi:hypothetical protein